MVAAEPSKNGGDVKVEKDLIHKIVCQIEYYFSDVNLRKDKFMKEEIAKDDDGWVPIDVLLTFNRLKNLTEERSVVAAALSSPPPDTEQSIQVSDDGTRVRRKRPYVELTEEEVVELNRRTVHFKGIALDATLDEIQAFCSQYGTVQSVEMRRFRDDKKFKGCVMCVYSSREEADKAIAGTEVYNKDIAFSRENKISWQERKEQFANKKRRKNGSDKKEGADGEKEVKKGDQEETDPVQVKGAILVLEYVPPDVNYDTIKTFFQQHGSVRHVDVDRDATKAFVRFKNENEAAAALKTVLLTVPGTVSRDNGKNGTDVAKERDQMSDVVVKEEPDQMSDVAKKEPDEKSGSQADEKEKYDSGKGAQIKKEAVEVAKEDPKKGPQIKQEADVKHEDVVKQEIDSEKPIVEIDGHKYRASVLTGVDEIKHWIEVNKVLKEGSKSRPSHNAHRKGRGFKRGGGGYKGKARNQDKRKSGDFSNESAGDSHKKVKV